MRARGSGPRSALAATTGRGGRDGRYYTGGSLLAEHFGDEEDDDGAADATSEEEISERISDGGDHGSECGDHHSISPPLVSEITIRLATKKCYGVIALWGWEEG